MSGGTISTAAGSYEVTDAVSGPDKLLLAATTPFLSDGTSVGSLYFDFSSGSAVLFTGDQQPLTLLSSPGFNQHKWLSLSFGEWNYQGEISLVSVTAVPEPGATAIVSGVVIGVIAWWRRIVR